MSRGRLVGLVVLAALMLLTITGCAAQPAAAQIAQVATNTPRPPAIPTRILLTSTATNTYTPSPIPAATLTDTPWPGATERPTYAPTSTLRPTATTIPTITPTFLMPTANDTVVAPVILNESMPSHALHLTGVTPNLRNVYLHGLMQGRDSRKFSKIGDCQSTSAAFLQNIDRGYYKLGEYTYLQDVIGHFAGSYKRVGPSALDGMHMNEMLDAAWSNPNQCNRGENRVECEYRLHNPSVVIIFIQPSLIGTGWQQLYHDSLTNGVQLSLQKGIIPVLSTLFGWKDHDKIVEETNRVIKQVAQENQVPVWDFHETVRVLPNGGDRGNWHMTLSPYSNLDFGDTRNFQYAMTYRNLEALQVLDVLWRQVMY